MKMLYPGVCQFYVFVGIEKKVALILVFRATKGKMCSGDRKVP